MGKGHEYTFFQRKHKNDQQVYENVLNITNYENANKSHNEISLHKFDKDVGKRELLYTVGENVN
jgi:hypothetical protein